MDRTIKAIFFDLGNVIVKLRPEALEEGFAPYGRFEKGRMLDFIMADHEGDVAKFMVGRLDPPKFYRKARRLFRLDITYTDFYRVWNSMFEHYPEVEEIIRRLKEKYPDIKLILVSNTNEAHYDFIRQNYDVLGLLDAHVVSHEIGSQKPDRSIYNEALRAAGSIPSETFYTDDRQDLIEAARVMGIRAFQFRGHETLREDLAACGVYV